MESLSLEETNALRIKIGLAPLTEDAGDSVDPDEQAYNNYQQMKDEQDKATREKETKERIEKTRNRTKNREKLKGKSIADQAGDDDALEWIRKMRVKEKKLAAKRAKEQEQQDESFVAAKYDAADLTGIKVGHDLTEFTEGGEMILTLKDRRILDEVENEDEEDELTNIQIEEKEKLKKNLDAKNAKPHYNPYDDEEIMLGSAKKSILSQYDDEPTREGFRIGKHGSVQSQPEDKERTVSDKLKEQSLSYEKMQEIKDYYTHEEQNVKFKKPKSKKKKKLRKREDDTEDSAADPQQPPREDHHMDQQNDAARPVVDISASFVDDDDLQEALARSRRTAIRESRQKLKKMTPEEIARSLAEEAKEEEDEDEEEDAANSLVISETTEFLNSLRNEPVTVNERTRSNSTRPLQAERASSSTSHDMQIDSDEDEEMQDVEQEADNEKTPKAAEVDVMEEPLVNRGMAATLKLLSQKGTIKPRTESQIEEEKKKMALLRESKKREEQRKAENGRKRDRGRGSARERYRESERGQEDYDPEEEERLRRYEEKMKDYKPNVVLEYPDEDGRLMNTKEAFRFQSHKFHGKTSGKTKTEKRMKKIEDQRKLDMMSSTDTPLNLAGALLERQKRTGSSHVVLSVGNRGVAVPDMPSRSAQGDGKGKKRSQTSSTNEEAESSKKRR